MKLLSDFAEAGAGRSFRARKVPSQHGVMTSKVEQHASLNVYWMPYNIVVALSVCPRLSSCWHHV